MMVDTMILRYFALLLPMTAVVHGITSCGTQSPDKAFATLDRARMNLIKETKHGRRTQIKTCDELCKGCIEVQTYFHLLLFKGDDGIDDFIPHPTTAVELYLADNTTLTSENFTSVDAMLGVIDAQIDVLNEHFADTPFYFTLMNPGAPSVTANTNWSRFAWDEQFAIGAALHTGNLATLNLYVGYSVEGREAAEANVTLAAFAQFPSFQFEGLSDGIFLRYDTLPGGGLPFNDVGITAVHEAGHWLGKLSSCASTLLLAVLLLLLLLPMLFGHDLINTCHKLLFHHQHYRTLPHI
jgi:hypothetical protein